MKKTLVIMAAGLGSRFGAGEGQKQVTPVDEHGQLIIDYSVYDAYRAGFEKVVFVIKPESRAKFHELIGSKAEKFIEVAYAFQTLDSCLSEGCTVPEGRAKPWGTGHAAMCAESEVPEGFVVINADDYYGASSFKAAAEFLDAPHSENEHAMVGFRLSNTVTPNGSVARGVCVTDENEYLVSITERTKIYADGENAKFTENGTDFEPLPGSTPVSMNFWIFNHNVFEDMHTGFVTFLNERMPANPLKAEYYLPDVPNSLLKSGKGRVKVLDTPEKWFGLTYLDDLDATKAGIRALKDAGLYPDRLWEKV